MIETYRRQLLNQRLNYHEKNKLLTSLSKELDDPKCIRKILQKEYAKFLREIWRCLECNTGYRLNCQNDSSEKLQLHISALEVMNKVLEYDVPMFLVLDVILPDDTKCLFDLLELRTQHVYCCLDSLNYTWTTVKSKGAHELLFGVTLQILSKSIADQNTRYGEMYEVVLASEDGETLVSDILSEDYICTTPHFRGHQPDKRNYTELCKISHLISPEYVWIQLEDDRLDFQKVQRAITMLPALTPLNPQFIEKADRVLVRTPSSKFTFRGEVLQKDADTFLVLAIDFGWTCHVPGAHVYQIPDNIKDVMNFAMLCRLSDVLPTNRETRLQLDSLMLLKKVTQNVNWARQSLTEVRLKQLLKLLHNSQDLALIRVVMSIFGSVSVNIELGRALLEPLTGQVTKYLECVEVMRPVMLFYRNVIMKLESVAKRMSRGSGIDLIMRIYSKHKSDPVISDHFVAIAKRIFRDEALEVPEVAPRAPAQGPQVGSAPTRSRGPPQDGMDYLREGFDKTFTQCENMWEHHGIKMGEHVSFLVNSPSSAGLDALARELASLLNTPAGGHIYMGVGEKGELRGWKLTRKTRDDFGLLVDDIMDDQEVLRSTSGFKIKPEFVDVKFEEINNVFNVRLDRGEKLMIGVISVRRCSPHLVRFNEVKDRRSGEFDGVFYGRRETVGRVVMDPNEIRQTLAV